MLAIGTAILVPMQVNAQYSEADANPDVPIYFGIEPAAPPPPPLEPEPAPPEPEAQPAGPKHWSQMSYSELEAEQARLKLALETENLSPVEKKNLRNLLKRVEAERIRILGQPQQAYDVQVPSMKDIQAERDRLREQRLQELRRLETERAQQTDDGQRLKTLDARERVIDTIRNRRYGPGAAERTETAESQEDLQDADLLNNR